MNYKDFKNALAMQRKNTKGVNRSAVAQMIADYNAGDYSKSHALPLYKNNGGTYCAALEILSACNYNIVF